MARKQYTIPGFSRYLVRMPYQVFDQQTGRPVNVLDGIGNRGPRCHLYDGGTRRLLTLTKVAALAFHGPPPPGFVAHHAGGRICPDSVMWVSPQQANSLRRTVLPPPKRFQVLKLYFEDGWTQDRIAKRFGCSQRAISHAINKKR